MQTLKDAAERLRQAFLHRESIAVLMHVSPDGDALGSCLALANLCRFFGAGADLYCEDPVPDKYRILPGWETIRCLKESALPQEAYDLCVLCDVPEPGRLGTAKPIFDRAADSLSVDHHGTNPCQAGLNVVNPRCAAAGELVLDLFDLLGAPLDPDSAACLYIALSTDTGHFQFSSTTADTLRAAARTLESGVDQEKITLALYRTRALSHTRLLGFALNSLSMHAGGRVSVMELNRSDFALAGASDEDVEGIVNYAIEIRGVCLAMLATQRGEGWKISLRARDGYDVAQVARAFGGGGHKQASGLTAETDEDKDKVVAALCALADGKQ